MTLTFKTTAMLCSFVEVCILEPNLGGKKRNRGTKTKSNIYSPKSNETFQFILGHKSYQGAPELHLSVKDSCFAQED
jgi:protein unc-13